MAVKTTLKAELLSLYNTAKAGGMTEEEFADGVTNAIDNYIRTFLVAFPISVQVNPATGTGATTAMGTLI